MANQQQKDRLYPGSVPEAPPPYISTQPSINNSSTIISFPEVVVNPQDQAKDLEPLMNNFDFNDKLIRAGFIRKVYALVSVQLLISAGVIAWFMNDRGLQLAVERNFPVFLGVTLGVYLTTALSIACCEGPRRRVPYNYLFLLAFTLALSALVGVACAQYRFQEVMVAGGITLAIVVSLTLFAFQTKIDFTLLTGSLLSLALVFALFGIALLTTPFNKLRLVWCALGVLIMCLYLVYDTQMMIGGKHRYALSPEEYVFAALNLYLDIMYYRLGERLYLFSTKSFASRNFVRPAPH